MRILLSNDDGIHAPGLHALWQALEPLGERIICAPLTQQSAVGHAITIADPLRVETVDRGGGFKGFGVSGTPADCVKLAYYELMDEPPDLLVSGINLGNNAGISILYSGTVSAATEGSILGIPSIAISLDTFVNPDWDTAAAQSLELLQNYIQAPLPPDTLLNINLPHRPGQAPQGVRSCPLAHSHWKELFHKRSDPHQRTYYWMDGDLHLSHPQPDSDLSLLRDGWITLSPVGLDRTRHDLLQRLKELEE